MLALSEFCSPTIEAVCTGPVVCWTVLPLPLPLKASSSCRRGLKSLPYTGSLSSVKGLIVFWSKFDSSSWWSANKNPASDFIEESKRVWEEGPSCFFVTRTWSLVTRAFLFGRFALLWSSFCLLSVCLCWSVYKAFPVFRLDCSCTEWDGIIWVGVGMSCTSWCPASKGGASGLQPLDIVSRRESCLGEGPSIWPLTRCFDKEIVCGCEL